MARLLTAAQAAYLAGIIDGEGCVRLQRLHSKSAKSLSGTAAITVTNTRLELMHWLVETTGAGTVTRRQRKPPHKLCYSWRIGSNIIRELMPQVEPYMVLKGERTRLILRYLEIRRGRPALTEDQRDEVAGIFAEVARQNAMGIHPERDAALEAWFGNRRCSEAGCERWCYPNQEYCWRHWVSRRVAQMGNCLHCGKEIEVVYQKRKTYCSSECRSKYFYAQKVVPAVAAEVATRDAKPCPACGKPVDRSHYARKVYCDDHCREVVRAKQKKLASDFGEERLCPQCGRAFRIGRHARKQVYCTSACVNAAYRDRLKEQAQST